LLTESNTGFTASLDGSVPQYRSAFLDDFPGAMFAPGLVIDPGPLTGQFARYGESAFSARLCRAKNVQRKKDPFFSTEPLCPDLRLNRPPESLTWNRCCHDTAVPDAS